MIKFQRGVLQCLCDECNREGFYGTGISIEGVHELLTKYGWASDGDHKGSIWCPPCAKQLVKKKDPSKGNTVKVEKPKSAVISDFNPKNNWTRMQEKINKVLIELQNTSSALSLRDLESLTGINRDGLVSTMRRLRRKGIVDCTKGRRGVHYFYMTGE